MEFRQLEAFVNAAKYKSFSKAADATFLTQPTISAHVNNLENELGVLLLNRAGREISLTPQGQAFYSYAADLLNTRSKAILSVQTMKEEPVGVLDIQASTIPGQYFLPQVLTKFHEIHPKVRFFVEQSDSLNVNENILNQKGEIGLTGYKGNTGLCFEPVFTDEMILITPESDRFSAYKDGDCLPVELFEKEPFILREEGSGTKEEMEKAFVNGKQVFKSVEVVARMNNMGAIKQAVRLGLGVSIVSMRTVTGAEQRDGIRWFQIEGLQKKRVFYLAYNKGICLSPAAEEFLALVLKMRDEMGIEYGLKEL